MNIQSVQHNELGGYDFVCDEGALTVGHAPGNRHYQAILEWAAAGGVIEPVPGPDLDAIKAQRIADLNAKAQQVADAYTAPYPEFEQQLWRDQEEQALAHLANPEAETPMLATMASIRGITVADLAGRVIANATTFRYEGALLIGVRQALEDQVNSATTVAEVEAVQWPEDPQ